MEQSIQIFTSSEFGDIQTLEVDGKIYFPATKVAEALGYTNPRDAILRLCKNPQKFEVECGVGNPDVTSRARKFQTMNFIDESDLYRLITHSKLPSAERFERWVFDEVLPSIRRQGYYAVEKPDSYMIFDPIERAKRWIEEEQERQRLIAENEVLKPKAQIYDEFVEKGHLIGFRDLAKQLNIKEPMLREILFNIGWCYRGQNGKLQPYKIHVDAGYLAVKDVLNQKTGYTGTQFFFTIQGRDQIKKLIENIRESEKFENGKQIADL